MVKIIETVFMAESEKKLTFRSDSKGGFISLNYNYIDEGKGRDNVLWK